MVLRGKVAIVTGGAQGIGKSICLALLENGCKVSISDVNEEKGKNTLKEFAEKYAGNVIFIKADVSVMEEFEAVFKKTLDEFGHVDILANNAGIMNEHNWRKVVDINFIGVINGIQLGFEHMGVDRGGSGGSIINTASNAGLQAFPLSPIYSGCKHGVVGLTKSFGNDFYYSKAKVTVSAICPGPVNTELFQTFPPTTFYEEEAKVHNSKVVTVKPMDVAKAFIQLLEEKKNGALLKVNSDGVTYA